MKQIGPLEKREVAGCAVPSWGGLHLQHSLLCLVGRRDWWTAVLSEMFCACSVDEDACFACSQLQETFTVPIPLASNRLDTQKCSGFCQFASLPFKQTDMLLLLIMGSSEPVPVFVKHS